LKFNGLLLCAKYRAITTRKYAKLELKEPRKHYNSSVDSNTQGYQGMYARVFFKALTGGTSFPVDPFVCPKSEGEISTFGPVD